MAEQKHTATPFELSYAEGDPLKFCADKIASVRLTVDHFQKAGVPIPDKWWMLTIPGKEVIVAEFGFGPTAKANAHFFHHVVAVHDGLIEALERIEARAHADTCTYMLTGAECDCHKAIARAALAKARGEG